MTWILPLIATVATAFILLVVAYLLGVIVPPLYEQVQASQAVADVGFDRGAEVAVRIGAQYILPLLALALVVWLLFLKLRRDDFKGQVTRRR